MRMEEGGVRANAIYGHAGGAAASGRLPEREFAYSAMFLMERMHKQLVADDLPLIEVLIVTKSWRDTVDLLASPPVGRLLARHPELIEAQTERWMQSGNLWLVKKLDGVFHTQGDRMGASGIRKYES
jgi:hypothetical protein